MRKKLSKEITKEFYCRLGRESMSGRTFIREMNLEGEVIRSICNDILRKSPSEVHNLTCVVKAFKQSITGDNYLAKKVLKVKLRVIIEEAELIDDVEHKKRREENGKD